MLNSRSDASTLTDFWNDQNGASPTLDDRELTDLFSTVDDEVDNQHQTNMRDRTEEGPRHVTVNGFVNEASTCYVHSFLSMCGHVRPIRDKILHRDFDRCNFMSTVLKLFQATILESVNPFREKSKKGINIELLRRVCGYPPNEDVVEVSRINRIVLMII